MELNFGPRETIQIDGARITHRNFSGRPDKFNREGDRNFSVIIPSEEMANALKEHTNRYGVGWNVKIRPPKEDGDEPFMYLKVKVAFNERGPKIYLKAGNRTIMLNEDTVDCLDDIDIESVDLDIRPYDDEMRGTAFRSAYLQAIWVHQDLSRDRFAARFAEQNEDSPY
jgi:hypothetical protein